MNDFGVMISVLMIIAQFFKKIGLKSELIPLLNLILGVLFSIVWSDNYDLNRSVQLGLMVGLSASGMYDTCMVFEK